MRLRFKLLLIQLFLFVALFASDSSDAEQFYKAEQWRNAEILYAKLLQRAPSNRVYNHRYGVCLLEQTKDLEKAESHLLKSQKMGITLSSFYLGRVAFMLYKFEEAKDHYSNYVRRSTDKERKAFAQSQLVQCEQGESMLKRTEDVEVIDRVMVDRSSFFKNYRLSPETGVLVEDPSIIGEDSICEDCTIYMTERKDRTFFSVNGDSIDVDLFYKNKLLDKWSKKVSLGEDVNTSFDEAYPFLMSDGLVLYFSSKGHNSLGGYDIFVTRFNATQNKFLPPQQLGMPFNSPGDDMLFVVDEYRNIGWFASDRSCPEGKVYIYTFIPNATISLLSTEDKTELRKAAMISEVDKDSVGILNSQKKEKVEIVDKMSTVEQAIYFVLNDTLVYSDMNDFMSDDARVLYGDYLNAVESCDSISNAMREKRKLYAKTVDPKEKSDLIAAIVELEDRQLSLGEKRDKMQQSVRRLEIETIRLNGGYKKVKPQSVAPPKEKNPQLEQHISPWEEAPASLAIDTVREANFYNPSLYKYYRQIFTPNAVEQLIEANRLRIKASDKLMYADYVMKEYSKPAPEQGFFERMFAYDTSFTEQLSYNQMVTKVTEYRDAAAVMIVESSLQNYFTLHGQNVLLLETVRDNDVRQQMSAILDNATFAMQEAKQQLYVYDDVLTEKAEKRSRGNGLLRKSIQYQEAASLYYLQYRYEKSKQIKARKPGLAPTAMPVDPDDTMKKPPLPKPEREVQVERVVSQNEPVKSLEEYRIQFGLYSRILEPGELALDEVTHYKYSEKQLYKHYTGHFKTQMEAAMALEAVKQQGFKDAFVVKFVNGKPE